MKTKTINLYEYGELSPEAQKIALEHYREHDFDTYGLQVHLDNEIEALLKNSGIVPVSTADRKYDSKYAKIYFSLSHSQGDGVMFEGTFTWKAWTVNIKQSGRYYHSNSKDIELYFNDEPAENEHAKKDFETIYQSICKSLETKGYAYIEDMESEEHFIEECNANEWTFREDGTREEE